MTYFNAGDRIVLDSMPEDPDAIVAGTTGTVTRSVMHDLGDGEREHVSVRWDNGGLLGLVIPPDVAHRIGMTPAQEESLRSHCRRYHVNYDEADYAVAFDLPPGYFAGWVGGKLGHEGPNGPTIYVGVAPDGAVSS